MSPPLFQSGICNFSSNSKFHTCNFTHNAATVSSRVIGLSRQAFPKQLTVHQLYYEYTSFTKLCHSHCLTLTSKLRNKVYTVDFGIAFCPDKIIESMERFVVKKPRLVIDITLSPF